MRRRRFFSRAANPQFEQVCVGPFRLHTIRLTDEDAPHDHPCWYVTLPFNRRGYVEEVHQPDGAVRERVVRGWWLNVRRRAHKHRILRPVDGRWPIRTLVLFGPMDARWFEG